jgi:zinc/manganese transport system substrate-binding protein
LPKPPLTPLTLLAGLAAAAVVCGCGRSGPVTPARGAFTVVAAENFWGSIAAELAGERASVRSIIVSPGTDPHSYEPNASDARTISEARVVILNGLGYDNWAERLLQASPGGGRVVLNVGDVLQLGPGANPHQWYSPAHVERVIEEIAGDYERVDPADAGYFAQRAHALLTQGLARYDALRRQIRARFAGTPVGYSESIFQPLGADLGLKLMTPYSFAKAISEGTDVTAADKKTVDKQAEDHLIKAWVYNRQNTTPDVQRVNELVRAAHIPIVPITETLSPATVSFQRWQASQLEALARALGATEPPTAKG